ncbi:imidazoleglycerol-phosphate dehydratase HisB [soil metagenome]
MSRVGSDERNTAETSVRIRLELDGTGQASVATGIGFFDHLLVLLARHALVDLEVAADGDLGVDEHHTVEDVALVLGRTLDKALGDRGGIRRFGDVRLPMDEALALCALDLGGRGFAQVEPRPDPLAGGSVWLELMPHFVETMAREGRFAVHLEVRGARSTHHLVEGAIKALARALRSAAEPDLRLAGVIPSTKGTLA